VSVLIQLSIAGCIHRGQEPLADLLAPSVLAADARFAERHADPTALDDAMRGWMGRIAEDPADRAALARLAQGEWLLSMRDPGQAEVHLANGEEYGWRCLLADPGLAAAVSAAGGRLPAAALDRLPDTVAPCVAWTAANGLDRALLRGQGAALAARDLRALAARARSAEKATSLVPWSVEGLPGLGAWLDARAHLLADPTAPAVRALFEDAVGQGPSVLRWRIDAAAACLELACSLAPAGDGTLWAFENRLVAHE
jgi:hypothetical protein